MTRKEFWQRRREGFGMNLYRNKKDGWLGGVCAGLADHFNIEPWIARLIVVIGLMFFGTLTFLAYIVACVVMARRPRGSVQQEYQYDETSHQDRPRNMFRYGHSPGERLATARERLQRVVSRVERMESYVTSKRFELDREFSKIKD